MLRWKRQGLRPRSTDTQRDRSLSKAVTALRHPGLYTCIPQRGRLRTGGIHEGAKASRARHPRDAHYPPKPYPISSALFSSKETGESGNEGSSQTGEGENVGAPRNLCFVKFRSEFLLHYEAWGCGKTMGDAPGLFPRTPTASVSSTVRTAHHIPHRCYGAVCTRPSSKPRTISWSVPARVVFSGSQHHPWLDSTGSKGRLVARGRIRCCM
jgi:hypothetical protein